ncbi:MAG TPA: 30S ribosomal protein S17 [Terriglobales bacterium]|nr:30S ribosomal protein S17 [Terriglobales bacterium]
MTAPENLRSSRRNEKVGAVVSTKMAKTVVVEVLLRKAHPLYRRGISEHRRFYAHAEPGACQVGDVVRIQETRPLSKLKRWRLLEVVRAASAAPTAEEIARAVGEGELKRDTRKEKPAPASTPAGEGI